MTFFTGNLTYFPRPLSTVFIGPARFTSRKDRRDRGQTVLPHSSSDKYADGRIARVEGTASKKNGLALWLIVVNKRRLIYRARNFLRCRPYFKRHDSRAFYLPRRAARARETRRDKFFLFSCFFFFFCPLSLSLSLSRDS